jgi:glutamate-ammonia-ligase adenylyltransferase
MALTRARPLFGSRKARAALDGIIGRVLRAVRDPAALRADVLKMRAEILAHKDPAGPLDCKLMRGGLVDCEFIVHFLQLRERAAFDPAVGKAIAALVQAGLLPEAFAGHHALLGRLLIAARLLAPDLDYPPEVAQAVLAEACGCPDFPALLQALAEARHGVAACWAALFGEMLEIEP